ncbi:MAG: hypothetical protein MZV65_12840 [Chromatiales bacterium]|nr:hypothetical protein [Chromatiales bacterium]
MRYTDSSFRRPEPVSVPNFFRKRPKRRRTTDQVATITDRIAAGCLVDRVDRRSRQLYRAGRGTRPRRSRRRGGAGRRRVLEGWSGGRLREGASAGSRAT